MAKLHKVYDWENLPDEELLQLRIRDLAIQIPGSPIEPLMQRLYDELDAKGSHFHPPCYLADEWLTPDKIPVIGIPFCLAHPRLRQLERKMMYEVEGGTEKSFMKLLRHECGHALNYAYQLYRRTRWRQLFGAFSATYSNSYYYRPYSRRFVIHLKGNYAQSHPDEDFAETFAVWLTPRPNWRKRYAGWHALRKLEYMDDLMREIAGKPPFLRSRAHVDPLRRIGKTLRQYYAEKKERYSGDYPDFLDSDIRKLFSDAPEFRKNESAAAFLRKTRPEIRRTVSRWTGHNQYNLDLLLKDVIGRCRELKLRLIGSPERTKLDVIIMLTVNTVEFAYSGRRWISL
jgi:hypothetical protein